MADHGTVMTDKQIDEIRKKLERMYAKAEKELEKKAKEHTKKFAAKDKEKQAQVKAGTLSEEQYKRWQAGQVFIGKRWAERVEQMAKSLADVDNQASKIIQGGQLNCFADNANYFQYRIDKDMNFGANFSLYDTATVTRLVRDEPELLRRRYVDGVQQRAWCVKTVNNCVIQGILQGESIDKIAVRLAKGTASSDMKAMIRYARTAMTGAQNGGRIEAMRNAKNQGINVRKMWIATMDERTRTAHQNLDGQIVDINEPFDSDLGPIMFPGDPTADGENVWNCRCALGYEYPDYPNYDYERGAYDEWVDEEGEEHREYGTVAGMTYNEWKHAKEAGKLDDYNAAKQTLFHWQKAAIEGDANHVFKGIWKDDVTYADYSAKKGSILAKEDYYNDALAKAQAAGDTAKVEQIKAFMDELKKFKSEGAKNQKVLSELESARAEVQRLAKEFMPQDTSSFGPNAYTQERKDNALWAQTAQQADKVLRGKAGEVWRAATEKEKDAAYEYTKSFHKFNEPLRGIEYGTSRFLGVGNTDLNASYANNGERLNALTDIIGKSTYDQDVWLQRGCNYGGMEKFFKTTESLLRTGTQEQLENELLGKIVTEYGFMSCGSNKGAGLNLSGGVLLNIYCPAGTQMMYVEPFSAFGNGSGKNWDGKEAQNSFGHEVETLLQQGTDMRVTKIERSGDMLYFDLEVVGQDKQQRWQK